MTKPKGPDSSFRPHAGETCKFYVSPEQPECGKTATYSVKTRITRKDSATVFLCGDHKHKYDEQYARMRVEPKAVL